MFDEVPPQPSGPAQPAAASAALARLAEQPADARAFGVLAGIDPRTLDAGAKIDYLRVTERLVCAATAMQQAGLAAVDGAAEAAVSGGGPRRPADFDDDWAREQVGAALRLAPATAERRLTVARTLAEHLKATLTALRAGRISYWQAAAIADASLNLRPELVAELEALVLPVAERQTVGQTRRTVEAVVIALEPKDADTRHRDAHAERRVDWWKQLHAMAELRAVLGADAVQIVMTALNGLVDAALADNPADPRTADQLRADLFTQVFTAVLTGDTIPTPLLPAEPSDDPGEPGAADDEGGGDGDGGPRGDDDPPPPPLPAPGRINRPPRRRVRCRKRRVVVVNTPGLDGRPGLGELLGYGPVPTALVQRVIGSSAVTVLTGLGPVPPPSPGYRPSVALDRYVRLRDRHCNFPGCNRAAACCDLDHIIPWPLGPTSADNLHCLCRRHHRLKTLGLWTVEREPDGGLTWTARTGHTYRGTPARSP